MAWIKRSLAGVVALSALIAAFLLAGGASALAATISTTSTEVEPGEVIEVTGSIDPLVLEDSVTFHWDSEDGDKIGKVQFVVLTYEATVTIPDTATAGEHLIYACDDTCGSTIVTVVVPTTTTTTTTTTTQPDSTTTTTQSDTTTTTTQPDTTTTTSGDSVTTTTDPGPAIASPSTTLVPPATTTPGPTTEGEASSTGPADPESSSTDDGSLDGGGGVTTEPEQGEGSSSDESGIRSQGTYIPPTTSAIPPATSAASSRAHRTGEDGPVRDNDGEEEDSGLAVVAAENDEGVSFDSPLLPWPDWMILVLLAIAFAANRSRHEVDAEIVYPAPMGGWRTIARRARQSLARLQEILTASSLIPLTTATQDVTPHGLPVPQVGGLDRHDDVYALQSELSPIQGDVLEAMAQAMTSWLDYYFLLGEGSRDKRLAHAAEGLRDSAERLRLVEKSIEDLIHGDDDSPLRAYQMAVSGWANAFETISAGAHFDHIALAHEGFARMSEASTIAEGVVLRRSNLWQHPSLKHQLSVLRDLRPAQHVRTRIANRAKVPWQRALQAAGSPLGWNDLSR